MDTPTEADPTKPEVATPSAQNQTMDVVAAPTTPDLGENGEEAEAPATEAPKAAEAEVPHAPAQPKTPRDNSVTVAITVAMLVVVALSGLAVYAYLSGKK